MSWKVKLILGLLIVGVVFPAAVFIDAVARQHFGGSMQIDSLPIENVRVNGEWSPDFFWVGKAWSIEVQSDQPVQLKLDGRVYEIPEGSHTIYSNHDHTNTGNFGAQDFWGYPEKIEILPLHNEP